jgi:uncharacterized protein (DUF2141 family)
MDPGIIKEKYLMDKNMEEDNFNIVMEIDMRAISKKIKDMVKGHYIMQIIQNMKDNGKMMNKIILEYFTTLIGIIRY